MIGTLSSFKSGCIPIYVKRLGFSTRLVTDPSGRSGSRRATPNNSATLGCFRWCQRASSGLSLCEFHESIYFPLTILYVRHTWSIFSFWSEVPVRTLMMTCIWRISYRRADYLKGMCWHSSHHALHHYLQRYMWRQIHPRLDCNRWRINAANHFVWIQWYPRVTAGSSMTSDNKRKASWRYR